MKKMLIQLQKLYPNSYISMDTQYTVDRLKLTIISEHRIYISGSKVFGNSSTSLSDYFSTLYELDKYISEKIKEYKRIYKDK